MVLVHELSSKLVKLLEQDYMAYQQTTMQKTIETGKQLPRTRFGWLQSHYISTTTRRNNTIVRAIENFNRRRGLPAEHVVFKNTKAYAKCMAPITLNDDDQASGVPKCERSYMEKHTWSET